MHIITWLTGVTLTPVNINAENYSLTPKTTAL
ncbi:hypothetical protein L585_06805 [Pantoea ananatis BRT175]|nr:hypothetical protein L585_06805 [Pantoea ananatis BRT175]PKC40868.1 hypothetical protein V461_18860 [Pantoea ananatis BRT98]CCF09852.1 hypothetical protein PANA5342_2459 [Pantoea ananatis LMG 5342]